MRKSSWQTINQNERAQNLTDRELGPKPAPRKIKSEKYSIADK